MQRHSRHNPTSSDSSILPTRRAVAILLCFNGARLLPTNVLYALVPPKDRGDYVGFRNLLTRMVRAGLLHRQTYSRGKWSNNETMTYKRLPAGERWLQHYDRPFTITHDGDRSQPAERCLVDFATASIKIAARFSEIAFHSFHEIRARKSARLPETAQLFFPTGEFYVTERGKRKVRTVTPDGEPFSLSAPTPDGSKIESIDFLKEIVRYNKTEYVIKEKARHYKKVKRDIEERLGTNSIMILFIATNKENAKNVLSWIKEEVGECKWMLVQTMTDHIREGLTTAPLATHLFDQPWDRPYPTQFSLKELRSLPKPEVLTEIERQTRQSNQDELKRLHAVK